MSPPTLFIFCVHTISGNFFYLVKQRRSISQESRALADRCHNGVKIFLKSHFIKYLPLYLSIFTDWQQFMGASCHFERLSNVEFGNKFWIFVCFLYSSLSKKERISVQGLERNHQSFSKSSMCPKMNLTGIV